MRKIIVTAMAVMLATTAFAVDWYFVAVKCNPYKGNTEQGYSCYAFKATDYSTWLGDQTLDEKMSEMFAAGGVDSIKKSVEGSTIWVSLYSKDSSLAIFQSYYGIADDGYANGTVLFLYDDGADQGYGSLTLNNKYSSSKFGEDSWSYTCTADSIATLKEFASIPEPTSGLLMLLGVAGLALRRRKI